MMDWPQLFAGPQQLLLWLDKALPFPVEWLTIGVQFLIVFFVVSWLYVKIYGTYIAQLLKGVLVVLAVYLVTVMLGWTILRDILQAVLQISVIGLIILFQPELRRMVVFMGQPDLLSRPQTGPVRREQMDTERLTNELIEAIRFLSKTKTGALLVLESKTSLGGAYLEAGTRLDARLSTEMLLTIFHTNTPLHDGAVIIGADGRIIAAGVLLPLSENPNLSWKYGTRHRAAIGLSEISDSTCLVVSEETGNVSIVSHGQLEKIPTMEDLKRQLDYIWGANRKDDPARKKTAGGLSKVLTQDVARIFQKDSPPIS